MFRISRFIRKICCTEAEKYASNLPTEILAEIFINFDPDEQKRFRKVCRSWNHTIEQYSDFEFWVDETNWNEAIQCQARNMSIIIDSMIHTIEGAPALKSFCSRIRKLEFHEITLEQNFYIILQNSESVYELIFNQTQLEPSGSTIDNTVPVTREKRNGSEFQGWLPALSILRFKFYNCHRIRCKTKWSNQRELLIMLSTITENSALKKFEVTSFDSTLNILLHSLPISMETEDLTSKTPASCYEAIEKIVQCNMSSLDTLNILALDGRTEELVNSVDLKLDPRHCNLKTGELRITGICRNGDLFQDYSRRIVKGLSPTIWLKSLLEEDSRQFDLRDLDLKFDNYGAAENLSIMNCIENLLSSIILKHSAQLVTINLKCSLIAMISDSTWEFRGVFSECRCLRSLTLKYTRERENEFLFQKDDSQFLTFTGMQELPPSIRNFSTNFALAFKSQTLDDLSLSNIPMLSTLALSKWNSTDCPWFIFNGNPQNEFSLKTYNTLQKKLPQLTSLCLKVTIDQDSVLKIPKSENVLSQCSKSISKALLMPSFKASLELRNNGVILNIKSSRHKNYDPIE